MKLRNNRSEGSFECWIWRIDLLTYVIEVDRVDGNEAANIVISIDVGTPSEETLNIQKSTAKHQNYNNFVA